MCLNGLAKFRQQPTTATMSLGQRSTNQSILFAEESDADAITQGSAEKELPRKSIPRKVQKKKSLYRDDAFTHRRHRPVRGDFVETTSD